MGDTQKGKNAKRSLSIKKGLDCHAKASDPKDNKERTSGPHLGMGLEWGQPGETR